MKISEKTKDIASLAFFGTYVAGAVITGSAAVLTGAAVGLGVSVGLGAAMIGYHKIWGFKSQSKDSPDDTDESNRPDGVA